MARRDFVVFCRHLGKTAELGARLIELPAEPQPPDAAFVEDGIVVFDELAVIARSGCETRRAETTSLADVVRPYRTLLVNPAWLDPSAWAAHHLVEVHPDEPDAAYALTLSRRPVSRYWV